MISKRSALDNGEMGFIPLPNYNARRYNKLKLGAQWLRAWRQTQIAQSKFDALVAEFNLAGGNELENSGPLIISAVCDDCNGLNRSVFSLLEWLACPIRFSSKWCLAVNDTIIHAQTTAANFK